MEGEEGLGQLPEVELEQAAHGVDFGAGEVHPLSFTVAELKTSTCNIAHTQSHMHAHMCSVSRGNHTQIQL